MQVRQIYSASARVRRMLNRQPQTEPKSADEVLPAPTTRRPARTVTSLAQRESADR
jgi:hypothetical protein